jgi:predicted TIM-barrel fold metal-dependent hydrolase
VAGNVAPIAHNYLIEDFLRDAADYELIKSVHVDGGWDDRVAETAWVQKVADAAGLPIAIVAGARLHEPEFAAQLEAHKTHPGFRGVRHILNWDPDPALTFTDRPDFMSDNQWLAGFALLERDGLSFDLQIYPWQLQDAARLASRFSNTLILLNHAGMPIHQRDMGLETWRRGIRELAARPNTAVKISGLGMVDWHWTTDSIRSLVLEAIEVFGVDRSMFASNFPVDKLYSSFSDIYRSFESIVSDFSTDEQHKLFAANAERYYRI